MSYSKKRKSFSFQFPRGRITQIYMKNFQIFDECTVFPGPKLNFILGPNGSGKSTIINAIALGLGGKPQFLERQDHVRDFIKTGSDLAELEIEVSCGKGRTKLFRRIISKTKPDKYYIDRKRIDATDFVDRVRAFNIHFDNLCQFLPQERVSQFASMTPQQRLKETERVVDKELLEKHSELIKKSGQYRDALFGSDQEQKNYEKIRVRFEYLKKAMERIERQKELMQKIQLLEGKLLWMKSEIAENKIVLVQSNIEKLIRKEKKIMTRYSHLNQNLEKYQKQSQEVEKEIRELEKLISKYNSRMKIIFEKLDSHDLEYQKNIEDIKNVDEDEERNKKQIQKLLKEIEELQKKNIQDTKEQENELSELTKKLKDFRNSSDQLDKEKKKVSKQKDDYFRRKQRNDETIREIENRKRKICDQIYQRFPAAQKAREWIDSHRNRFKHQVFGPIGAEVEFHSKEIATIFETQCFQAINTFVFLCEEDLDFFFQNAYQKEGIKIPLYEWSKKPLVYNNPFDINEIPKNLGEVFFLDQGFDAVDSIKECLIDKCKIEKTLCYRGSSERTEKFLIDNDKVMLFYTSTHKYMKNISRYSSEVSYRTQQIRSTRFYRDWTNYSDVQGLKQQSLELENQIKELDIQFQNIEKQQIDLHRDNEGFRKRKNILDNEIRRIKIENAEIQRSLKNKQKDLKDKQKKNFEILRVELIHNKTQNLQSIEKKNGQILDELRHYSTSLQNSNIKQIQKFLILEEKNKCSREIEEYKSKHEQIFREKTAFERQLKDLQEEFKNFREKAIAKTGEKTQILEEQFAKLPNDINEIERQFHKATSKLNSLESEDADAIIKEYEEKKIELERISENIKNSESIFKQIRQEMEIMEREWIVNMEEIIKKLNVKFEWLFEQFGGGGEIQLIKAQNYEYENYGIDVLVQFHSSKHLQKLTSARQSGGERTVSTALYLIALHRCTQSPFCIIDEINQGMDPDNDKKTFQLLANSVRKESVPQYFVISPKLLPSLLPDDDSVNNIRFHFVFNGVFLPDYNHWIKSKYVKKYSPHLIKQQEQQQEKEKEKEKEKEQESESESEKENENESESESESEKISQSAKRRKRRTRKKAN
ncbi:structural maintenance of chromosomes protein [Anaeramoeba ignava]|uniref:Structural maintenance of chromosomes protein 5 n=1 Tax=Anaeramoeba ignava TaxID=1746090 RepID=A0A9Q0L6C0_ANAIG|nr:structural maintenance of chromosomes protein [Anaeramoeba ignava]